LDISEIRATIAQAKHHESATGQLRRLLTQQLPTLHTAIQLPQLQPVAALLEFVSAYIESAPDFLEAAAAIVRDARIEPCTQQLLQLAQDNFLKPSEADHPVGLDELMNEAYLLHRLLEELNDRYRIVTGAPLLPQDMDTTAANLIGHHLIGEPFANALDEAVHFSIDQLMHRLTPSFGIQPPAQAANEEKVWASEERHWPRLTQPLSLSF